MSTIRKQSLISSVIVYLGFALGMVNVWLFTRVGGFTKEQFGVTATFLAFSSVLFSLSSLGSLTYVTKFFPYYNAHLDRKKNDQFTWALLFPVIGFAVVTLAGILFKDLFVRVFNNSPQLVRYYYWLYPFSFGYTVFMVLEGFAWFHGKSVLSNFYKEVLFRLLLTVIIVLTTWKIIPSFDDFVRCYAFLYGILALLLATVLWRRGVVHFQFRPSKVTRRLRRRIVALVSFSWGSSFLLNLAQVIDTIIIAAILPNGVAMAGLYSLGATLSGFIQAPQRAVVSASVSHLSEAWRAKDEGRILRIYQRSAINQLIFATAMFCLIWLNFRDALLTFNIQSDFLVSSWVFFFMGLRCVVDMGTGVSSQIIATSTHWRFEFTTGLVLVAVAIPLNVLLTMRLGIYGPALSSLLSYIVYNTIRYFFLWRRFRMQPFSAATVHTLLLAGAAYAVCYFAFRNLSGFWGMTARSAAYLVLFASGTLLLRLSPDVLPVWETAKKRMGLR
ncbi:lipopolysaccharide biosynthesis protein [Flaviaesturariibacter amylovorans]|uniref:Lipopolysaccharide biosynthesis protein n=1 Tax=Flaviaesturariibacter amylovorans TaxID=1084520 RepID=A0ABP8GID2_9BACT